MTPTLFNVTFNKIVACVNPIENLREVYDFQIENHENFFIKQNTDTAILVHNCLLKPLEEPSKDTIWILCSMDPSKFQSGDGRALANRCKQIVLEPHSPSELLKQALRIAKGENMNYALDEDRAILKSVVKACGGEMRTLANIMENLSDYYNGLEKKPKLLTKDAVTEVLSSSESSDDKLAIELLIALFNLKFAKVQRCLIDVGDGFSFIKKLSWLSQFLLNNSVLEGGKHPKVWWSPANRELFNSTKELKLTLGTLASVNSCITKVHAQASNFQIPAQDLLSAEFYYLIKSLASSGK